MNKNIQGRVDLMIMSGITPTRLKGSEALALKWGNSIVKLLSTSGERTAAGDYWKQSTGTPLPAGGYLQQTAVHCRKGATRKWDEATGVYKFTKLGKQYYKIQRRNYLVSVPVIINGNRKDGTTYRLKSRMPIEKLGLKPKSIPLDMDSPTRHRLVKGMVQDELPDGALYEVSDETWTVDPTGNRRISEETVRIDRGVGDVDVVLDRRLGARPVFSQLLFAEALCEDLGTPA